MKYKYFYYVGVNFDNLPRLIILHAKIVLTWIMGVFFLNFWFMKQYNIL